MMVNLFIWSTLFASIAWSAQCADAVASSFGTLSRDLRRNIMELSLAMDKASMRRVHRPLDGIYREMMKTDNVSKMKLLMNQIMNQSVDKDESTLTQIRALHSESQFSEQYALEMPMYLNRWRKDMHRWMQSAFDESVAEKQRRASIFRRVTELFQPNGECAALNPCGINAYLSPDRWVFRRETDGIETDGECPVLDPFTKLLVIESQDIWRDLVNGKEPNLFDLRLYRVLWEHLESWKGPQLPSMHAMYRIADDSKGRYLRRLVMDCGLILIHPHYLDADRVTDWSQERYEVMRKKWVSIQVQYLKPLPDAFRNGIAAEATALVASDRLERGLPMKSDTFRERFVWIISHLSRLQHDHVLRRYLLAWKRNYEAAFYYLMRWTVNQDYMMRKLMEDLEQDHLKRLLVIMLEVAMDDPAVTRSDTKQWIDQLMAGRVIVNAEGVVAVWNGPIPPALDRMIVGTPWLQLVSTLSSSSDGFAVEEYGSI